MSRADAGAYHPIFHYPGGSAAKDAGLRTQESENAGRQKRRIQHEQASWLLSALSAGAGAGLRNSHAGWDCPKISMRGLP